MNITGGADLTLFEVNEAAEIIQQAADPDAEILFGCVHDERLSGIVKVTVIATGFDRADDAQAALEESRRSTAAASAARAGAVPARRRFRRVRAERVGAGRLRHSDGAAAADGLRETARAASLRGTARPSVDEVIPGRASARPAQIRLLTKARLRGVPAERPAPGGGPRLLRPALGYAGERRPTWREECLAAARRRGSCRAPCSLLTCAGEVTVPAFLLGRVGLAVAVAQVVEERLAAADAVLTFSCGPCRASACRRARSSGGGEGSGGSSDGSVERRGRRRAGS